MKHKDLPHVQKYKEHASAVDTVITLLEDMRDECGSNGVRNAAILARDAARLLTTVREVNEHLTKSQ